MCFEWISFRVDDALYFVDFMYDDARNCCRRDKQLLSIAGWLVFEAETGATSILEFYNKVDEKYASIL